MDETRVSASEFQADFAALSERARHEPVIITDGEGDALVVVCAKEWSRIKRLASELPSCWIEAVRVTKAPDEPAVPEAELKLRRRLQGVSL